MKTITLNNEKYVLESEANEAIKAKHGKTSVTVGKEEIPFKIGEKYFIRTVTYFATGEVVAVHGQFLELSDAAWVADTGRFSTALSTGVLSEIEPVEVPMYINIASITDAFVWNFKLPREQK